MLFSSNLLKQYISLHIESQNLMSEMTLHACEVEQILSRQLPNEVVIGYVTDTKKHPNADTLTICQLDCGIHGSYQICTAADNIRSQIFVPVALPWCYLPAIDLTIGARQMRWEDSNGMICAKVELGINEDADQHGIWILDEDFADITQEDIGMVLSKKYEWLDNTILDVDNKTINNRPDLTWLLGMAIEMKAIFSYDHKQWQIIRQQNITNTLSEHYPTRTLELLGHSKQPRQQISIKTPWCSVYSLLQLDGIQVRKSPFYDRLALIDSGLSPKNNWVDFSNLFMTIVGQPIHIFDADKIKGTIVVRNATDGEKMIDLTGLEHDLKSQDIVIADDSGVIALAGVIGWISTAVTDATKNIVIEMAHFDPVATRRTSMRIGVRTDAVMRFEKTLSPLLSLTSLSIILDLLKQYAPMLWDFTFVGMQSIMSDEVRQRATSWQWIQIDPTHIISLLLGRVYDPTIDDDVMISILTLLWFTIKKETESEQWNVCVPWWRGSDDMNIAEDIAEEIVRIYGYDRIQSLPYAESMTYVPLRSALHVARTVEQILVQRHQADQLQTYPRCDELFFDLLDYDRSHLVKLRNSTTPELSYLRPSLLPNLLQAVAKNSKIYDYFTLFDSGQTRNKSETFSRFLNKQSFETTKIGIVSYKKEVTAWRDDTLLQVKDMISDIVHQIWLQGELSYTATSYSYYHPKKQWIIYLDNHEIGYIAQYHPNTLENLKIDPSAQVVGAELYLEKLEDIVTTQGSTFEFQNEYLTIQDQILTRDVSFVISKDLPFWVITSAIQGIDAIIATNIFDLYQWEHLPADKKSIALSLTIRGNGKRSAEQINAVVDEVIQAVQKVGGEVR